LHEAMHMLVGDRLHRLVLMWQAVEDISSIVTDMAAASDCLSASACKNLLPVGQILSLAAAYVPPAPF
jgi:hypothetical protein